MTNNMRENLKLVGAVIVIILVFGVIARYFSDLSKTNTRTYERKVSVCSEVCKQKGYDDSFYTWATGCDCKNCTLFDTFDGEYESCEYIDIPYYSKVIE